jgi:hypothetical protein
MGADGRRFWKGKGPHAKPLAKGMTGELRSFRDKEHSHQTLRPKPAAAPWGGPVWPRAIQRSGVRNDFSIETAFRCASLRPPTGGTGFACGSRQVSEALHSKNSVERTGALQGVTERFALVWAEGLTQRHKVNWEVRNDLKGQGFGTGISSWALCL